MMRYVLRGKGKGRLLFVVVFLVVVGIVPISVGLAAPVNPSIGQSQLQTNPEPENTPSSQAQQVGEQVGAPVGERTAGSPSPAPEATQPYLSDVLDRVQTSEQQGAVQAPAVAPEDKSESAPNEFRINTQYLVYGLLGIIAVLVILFFLRK